MATHRFKGIDAKLNEIAVKFKTQVTMDVGGYTINGIAVPREKIELRKIIWIDGDIGKGIIIEPNFEDGNFDSPTWQFTNLAWLEHGETEKKFGKPMWARVLLKKEKFATIERDIDQLLNRSIEDLQAIKRSDLK